MVAMGSDILVTQDQVNDIFNRSELDYKTIFGKCTVVTAKLPNGFIIVESSACVDPANFSEEIGADICNERIKNKIWELEGYKLQSEVAEKEITGNEVTGSGKLFLEGEELK